MGERRLDRHAGWISAATYPWVLVIALVPLVMVQWYSASTSGLGWIVSDLTDC